MIFRIHFSNFGWGSFLLIDQLLASYDISMTLVQSRASISASFLSNVIDLQRCTVIYSNIHIKPCYAVVFGAGFRFEAWR
jgi:hypothetical protein